jgi:hypothetical protein
VLRNAHHQFAAFVAETDSKSVFSALRLADALRLDDGLGDGHGAGAGQGGLDDAGDHIGDLLCGVEGVGFRYRFDGLHEHGGGGDVGELFVDTDFDAALPGTGQFDAAEQVARTDAEDFGHGEVFEFEVQHLLPELGVSADDGLFVEIGLHGEHPCRGTPQGSLPLHTLSGNSQNVLRGKGGWEEAGAISKVIGGILFGIAEGFLGGVT